MEVFHHISRHREVIYQTLGEVFDSISQHRKLVYKTREGVIHPISRHRQLICQTRVGVLNRWSGILNREVIYQTRVQTPTSDISNGRRVSNDIQTLESYTSNTDEKFFTSDIKTRKRKIQNTRECVKLYTQSLQSNILDTRRSNR